MKLNIESGFKWAHRGVEIEEFYAGQSIETEDQELIAVAIAEGWASEDGEQAEQPKKRGRKPAQ